jgi:WD40 repeat protein
MRLPRHRFKWLAPLLATATCALPLVGAAPARAEKTVMLDGTPMAVAFSPDSEFVATANRRTNTIDVRKTAGGSLDPVPGSPFHTGTEPLSVDFSPNGKLLAAANARGNEVSMYQVAAVGSLKRAPESPVSGVIGASQVAFTPDGKVLVSLGHATLSFFSVGADGKLDQMAGSPIKGVGGESIAISPDGKLIAVAGVSGGRAVNVSALIIRGDNVHLHPLPGSPVPTGAVGASSVAFNPAGTLLAVGNEERQSVSMFALLTDSTKPIAVQGSPFDNLGERGNKIDREWSSVAFSPNGHVLAASNTSAPDLEVEVGSNWSSASFFSVGDSLNNFGHLVKVKDALPLSNYQGPVFRSAVAYSPDGRWFAATTAERVSLHGWLALFPNPPYDGAKGR